MNPKELRIGNRVNLINVLPNEKRERIVQRISPTHLRFNGFGSEFKISDVEPIPLTEEWLGKFGFEKTAYRLVCYENNKYIFEMTVEEIGGFSGRRKYFVPVTIVEYVHQVQNLYFALTNQELLIK